MKIHDSYINQILEYLKGFESKTLEIEKNTSWTLQENSDYLLDKEVAVELGSTENSSVSFNLSTSEKSFNSSIQLYGNDLNTLKGRHPDYAKIIITSINVDEDETVNYKNIKRIERMKYKINLEGMMLRASTKDCSECLRISKKAIKKDINFSTMASLLMHEILALDYVNSVQIIYVVDMPEVIKFLRGYAQNVYKTIDAMNHMFDDIELDCSTCSIKEVCDEIEGLREAHHRMYS